MAKQSGLGDQLFVHGYDLSGDVSAVGTLASPNALLDMTGIDKSAHERIYGLSDGQITFNHFFNDAANAEHDALKAKGSGADRVVTYFKGSAIGNMAAGLVAKQINFDWNRNADGTLMGTSDFQGNGYNLDYCEQLTAGKITHASASNGSSHNYGAATANGLAGYCQAFSLTSGSPTVKIQSSSDDGGSDAFADVSGATFGVVAANTGYHFVTSSLTASIEQYLRVVTTGTFSTLVFAVCVTRFPVAL